MFEALHDVDFIVTLNGKLAGTTMFKIFLGGEVLVLRRPVVVSTFLTVCSARLQGCIFKLSDPQTFALLCLCTCM